MGIWLNRCDACNFFPCGNILFCKDCSQLESPKTRMDPSNSGCKWCREMLVSSRKSSHRTLTHGCSSQMQGWHHCPGHRVCLNLTVWLCYAGHQDKLGVAETKLLHTLHWMLLEAPQDCNSERFGGTDRGSSWGGSSSAFVHQVENQGSPGQPCQSAAHDEEENNRRKIFQNSMATVELFVFLFAPLVHRIKVSRKLIRVKRD